MNLPRQKSYQTQNQVKVIQQMGTTSFSIFEHLVILSLYLNISMNAILHE